MKDATGELSMTAVAVVAIAAISVLFSTLIWPTIKQNIMRSTYCSGAFDCSCTAGNQGGETCECWYCPSSAGDEFAAKCDNPEPITCTKNEN